MEALKKIFKSNDTILRDKYAPHFKQQKNIGGDGLACAASICSIHKVNTTLETLTNTYAHLSQGISLKQIMELFNQLGFLTKALQCPTDELLNLKLPAILHWDMKQFVVLAEITSDKFVLINPAVGVEVINKNEFEQHFGEIVLEITVHSKLSTLA